MDSVEVDQSVIRNRTNLMKSDLKKNDNVSRSQTSMLRHGSQKLKRCLSKKIQNKSLMDF